MSWNKLEPELQQQVIDKLVDVAFEQKDQKLSNAYLVASDELEMWLNNLEFSPKVEDLEDDAVTAQDPLTAYADLRVKRAEQKAFMFGVIGASSTLGALVGAQLSSFIDPGWVFATSLFCSVVAGVSSFILTRKNND